MKISLSDSDDPGKLFTPDIPEGVKFDQEKPRLDLIPPEVIEELGIVLGYGAKKYAERNWEKGMAWSRVYAAALRHILKWWEGEEIDPESGLPHISHALCNLAFLVTYCRRDIGTDDRPRNQ